MKLIDKDVLVAEINRLIAELVEEGEGTMFEKGRISAFEDLKLFIDSLEVKEMDLDDFIKEEFNRYSCVDGYGQLSVSYNEAEFYSMIKRLTKAQKGENYG